jgi:REP element-mobilizing transposase RayT
MRGGINTTRALLNNDLVTLNEQQRAIIETAVRTNHVHAVVSADVMPERILNALKANATKMIERKAVGHIGTARGRIRAVGNICGMKAVSSVQLIM